MSCDAAVICFTSRMMFLHGTILNNAFLRCPTGETGRKDKTMTWRFTIIEKSVFNVDLNTEDKAEAYEKIRDMFLDRTIDITDPDYYENTEEIEAN